MPQVNYSSWLVSSLVVLFFISLFFYTISCSCFFSTFNHAFKFMIKPIKLNSII